MTAISYRRRRIDFNHTGQPTMMNREARTAAAALRAANPGKAAKDEPGREAWMNWRGECLRAAQARAQSVDIATFLEACGSPD